jgi:purine-binding chemotaxis protein CheW
MSSDNRGQKGTTESLHEQQLVVFKVAGEEFGVNINEVKEIIRWEDVTRIPNSAPYIKGVINLRGSIIVVNDLAMKLGLPSKEVDDDTRILVVEVSNNQTVGMIVDSATEVMRLSADKIRDAPSMVTTNVDSNYVEGVGLLDEKRLLTLLDLSKVLESQDYQQILQVQQQAQLPPDQGSKNAKSTSTSSEDGEIPSGLGDNVANEKDTEDEKKNTSDEKKDHKQSQQGKKGSPPQKK